MDNYPHKGPTRPKQNLLAHHLCVCTLVCVQQSLKLSIAVTIFYFSLFSSSQYLQPIPYPTWADRPLPFFPGSPEDIAAKMRVQVARKQKKLGQVCICVVKTIITQLLG